MGGFLRVLVVELAPTVISALLHELWRAGYQLDHLPINSAAALQAALDVPDWNLVLVNHAGPSLRAVDVLALLQERGLDLPCIVISVMEGTEAVVGDLKAGAHDFILLDHLNRLPASVERELREADIRRSNRQLLEQVRRDAVRAELLVRVGARLNARLDLAEVLEVACKETARALEVPAALVSLCNPKGTALAYAADFGLPADLHVGLSAFCRALFNHYQPNPNLALVVIPNVLTLPEMPALPSQLHAAVNMSLRRDKELLGVLSVFMAPDRREISEDELALLRGLADQVSLALTNARLLESANRRLHRLQALRHIDEAIKTNADLRSTLDVLLGQLRTHLQVDAADILLFDAEARTLNYGAGHGFHSQALQHTHLRLGEGYAGRAALSRTFVHLPDLAQVSAFAQSPLLDSEGFVTYFGFPLLAHNRLLGVLEIFHRSALDPNREWVDFLETLAGQAAIAVSISSLLDHLRHSNTELALAYDNTLQGWSQALDLRDRETNGHTLRVTDMTLKLARRAGIREGELAHIRRGALLHDIGKLGIPDSILLKPGPLTPAEWDVMRQHPIIAHDLLSTIDYLRPALVIPYCHHEKWDGTGYPRGLRQEQIPLAARIFAVVDVWDALCSNRPYRAAWPEADVQAYLRSQAGTHFDAQMVDLFFAERLQ